MRGDTVIKRGDLVVRDRRIVALGPSGTISIPRDAHVIDATGRTIMPGLVDLHNHVLAIWSRPGRQARYPQVEANLAFGVLTSRDPQALALDFLTLEDLAATGQLLGPRIRHTGPGYDVPYKPPTHSLADMRATIRRYADVYQVGYIKHYYGVPSSRRVQQWLVMAAAERRLNVVVHGQGGQDYYQFLSTVIDGYGGYDHSWGYPWPFYADIRQLLAHTGITLAHHPTESARRVPEDPDLRAKLGRFGVKDSAGWYRALEQQRTHEERRPRTGSLALAIAAGVRVALGSHGEAPGFGTHQELWTLVADGVPPLEALRIGTLRGAEALGLERDLGSLAAGKLADLLVLDENPLENIQHTARLRWVLFNGRLYDASTLDEQWPRRRVRTPGWWETRPASP
jgi:hypothetical protein